MAKEYYKILIFIDVKQINLKGELKYKIIFSLKVLKNDAPRYIEPFLKRLIQCNAPY